MIWLRQYTRSSIGMKQLMALTGLALAGFVFIHMAGNLQVFGGRDLINDYAEKLQSFGPLLWILRGGLLVVFLLHAFSGIRLYDLNKTARPSKYVKFKRTRSSWYSRYMAMTGFLLLLFIALHLAHFTFGAIQTDAHQLYQGAGGELLTEWTEGARHDVYAMMVTGFSDPLYSILYLVAMVFLCMHLAHGVTSFVQTLGGNHPKYNKLFRALGPVYGWLLFIGNASIVIAVLSHMLSLEGIQ